MQNYVGQYQPNGFHVWNQNMQYINAQLEIQNAALAQMIDTLVYNNNMYRQKLQQSHYTHFMTNSYRYQQHYPPTPVYEKNYNEYSMWNGTRNPIHILRKKTDMDMLYDSMNTFDTSYRL